MKIIKFQGGLGNQLFQYAFARAFEERGGDEVYVDLSTYSYEETHNGFELSRLFDVRFKTAAEADIMRLGTRPRGRFSAIRRKFFTKRSHHIDRVFRYDPQVFSLSGDRYLEGWWQTEKYFAPIADDLRREFRFIADPGERNLALMDAKPANGFAAIHVRRGDTLRNPDTWVCTDAYYRRAFAELRSRRGDQQLLIFSDDLDWCRSNFGFKPDEATYVDWNRASDSWRDLWLMSRCSSAIIANSTFSWWGAWLNPDSRKLIIAPDPWSLAKPRIGGYYRYRFDEVVPDAWLRVPIG
jgi:hypothetical protein